MASYSYVNGIYPVTVQIRDGWKRLNKCNAQVQHLISQDGRRQHWNFISYNTPICRVSHNISKDGTIDGWRIDLSHDWNCSVSTQRQLQKFFAMFNLPCNTYYCKELDRLCMYTAQTSMHYQYNNAPIDEPYVEINFIDNDTLLGWMISNASRSNSFPMIIANN